MQQNSEKEKAIKSVENLMQDLNPTERLVFIHRYAAGLKLKPDGTKRANELIRKIGFEEAAKLSTDEFLKRVEAETPRTPTQHQKLEFSADV